MNVEKRSKAPTIDLSELFAGDPESYGHDDFMAAADVTPMSPEWYWRDRLVANDLNILAGTQGVGKSQIAMAIAAEATRADHTVLIISAEDSPQHTIVPRLLGADASLRSDVDRRKLVHIWRQDRPWGLSDAEKLQEYIYQFEADFVIIDPVAAFVTDKTDSYKDSHVRQLLSPLRRIAEDQGCTILTVMHLKKGIEAEAVNTVGGSVAWTAAPRSVLLARKDQEGGPRVLWHAKCNVGPEQPALPYEIVQDDYGVLGHFTTSHVTFLAEEPDRDIEAAFRPPPVEDGRRNPPTPAQDRAVAFLKNWLADGEWELAGNVNAGAADDGVTPQALAKARKLLKMEQKQDPPGTYWWRWPAAVSEKEEEEG